MQQGSVWAFVVVGLFDFCEGVCVCVCVMEANFPKHRRWQPQGCR